MGVSTHSKAQIAGLSFTVQTDTVGPETGFHLPANTEPHTPSSRQKADFFGDTIHRNAHRLWYSTDQRQRYWLNPFRHIAWGYKKLSDVEVGAAQDNGQYTMILRLVGSEVY